MGEDIPGPLRVFRDSRQTVVDGTSLFVGRRRPAPGEGEHVDPDLWPTLGEGAQPDPLTSTGPDAIARLVVGSEGAAGAVTVTDETGRGSISLAGGFGSFGTGERSGSVRVRGAQNGPVIELTGEDGRVTFRDAQLRTTLIVDGVKGDIEFTGADCAEDFDVIDDPAVGSVVCVDEVGALRCCSRPYDPHVAGVVSGAGGSRAALRLGRQANDDARAPIALIGKVYCLAEADSQPIGIGHLLTTSATPGHAMRATDRGRSFGAVLGKSMGTLNEGRGLVPVLVALQ